MRDDLEARLRQDAPAWRDTFHTPQTSAPTTFWAWHRYRLPAGGLALAAAIALAGLIYLAWPSSAPPAPARPTTLALPTWKHFIPPMPTTPTAPVPSVNAWIVRADATLKSPYRQEARRLNHDARRALRVVLSLAPRSVRQAVAPPPAS